MTTLALYTKISKVGQSSPVDPIKKSNKGEYCYGTKILPRMQGSIGNKGIPKLFTSRSTIFYQRELYRNRRQLMYF